MRRDLEELNRDIESIDCSNIYEAITNIKRCLQKTADIIEQRDRDSFVPSRP